jgi:uncharacterized protein YajQ (UPF0234 family)
LNPFAFRLQLFYAFAMPSFDIVSQVNSMEIENAVNQAKKELANRFDFKGSQAEIILEKTEIKLTAEDQFKVTTCPSAASASRASSNASRTFHRWAMRGS